MFRIYKEELSSIFLKFLKLYLVRYCINKYFGFVTVVTSLTCGNRLNDYFHQSFFNFMSKCIANNYLGLRQTIVCFYSFHTALSMKSKHWLAGNLGTILPFVREISRIKQVLKPVVLKSNGVGAKGLW
jgi:hypothetical protein